MTASTNQKMPAISQARAEHINAWIDQNRARRKALSQEEAATVAGRVDANLRRLKMRGISRSQIAKEAFRRDGGSEDVLNLLRYYAVPAEKADGRRLSRSPDKYRKLIRAMAGYLEADEDDLLISIFANTQADRGTGPTVGKFARTFEERLRRMTDQIAADLGLRAHFRDAALYGAGPDYSRPGWHLTLQGRGGIGDPELLFPEAAIPVLNAMIRENGYGLGVPWLCRDRLPTVPLYRIRATDPYPVDMRLTKVTPTEPSVITTGPRQGELVNYFELRLGIGPENEAATPAPLFELVTTPVLRVTDPGALERPTAPDTREMMPEALRDFCCLDWFGSNDFGGYVFHWGHETYRGTIRAKENGQYSELDSDDCREIWDRWYQVSMPWNQQVDPESAVYFPADATAAYELLMSWPHHYEERVEWLNLAPRPDKGPVGGFFPSGSVGEELERQLLCQDRSPQSVYTKVKEASSRFVQALQRAREEEYAAHEIAESEAPPSNGMETEQLLAVTAEDWRRQHGLSQAQAARRLGLVVRTYGAYERGERPMPPAVRLAMLFYWLRPELAQAVSAQAQAEVAAEPGADKGNPGTRKER